MLTENLFSRLNVDKALRRAFNLFFYRPGVFLPIGVAESIPLFAFSGVSLYQAKNSPDPSQTSPVGVSILILFIFLVLVVVSVICKGATIRATAEIYAKKQPKLLPCLREGRNHGCTIFFLSMILVIGFFSIVLIAGAVIGLLLVLMGFDVNDPNSFTDRQVGIIVLVTVLASFLYICGGIAVYITSPSIVLENKPAWGGMKRTWELVACSHCYVFCTIFAVMFLNFVVGLIGNALFGNAGPFIGNAWQIVATPVLDM